MVRGVSEGMSPAELDKLNQELCGSIVKVVDSGGDTLGKDIQEVIKQFTVDANNSAPH